jgi:N-acetylglucosamine-6-phosphate deacetylase
MVIEGLLYLDNSPVSIDIKDGIIQRVVKKRKLDHVNQLPVYIAPGLIDHQVNGYIGHSFVDEDLSVDRVRQITETLWQHGVTSYFPTLITSSQKLLIRNLSILRKAIANPDIGLSIPGFHLEGPYISPLDEFYGAHPKEWIRASDWNEFVKLNEASGNNIREITIAPEIDGAIDFIRNCKRENIVVGLGHHNGSADVIKKAVDAGAAVSTHLGNGIANFIHHHDNPIWPQLADDRLIASMVVDGFHLRPEEVQVFLKVKGPDRITLVSDVSRLGGLPPGKYNDLILTSDGMVYFPAQNVKAGASFLVGKGIENVLKYTQCTLADTLHMVTRNVARLFGLHDRGNIEHGKRADLIMFSIDSGKFKIHKTILAGKIVYDENGL